MTFLITLDLQHLDNACSGGSRSIGLVSHMNYNTTFYIILFTSIATSLIVTHLVTFFPVLVDGLGHLQVL